MPLKKTDLGNNHSCPTGEGMKEFAPITTLESP